MTYSYPNTLQNRHSYATLAQLKNVSWLNITDTLSDVGLLDILETVSKEADRKCNRFFYLCEDTRYFDGGATRMILDDDLYSLTALNVDPTGSGTYSLSYDPTATPPDFYMYPLNRTPTTTLEINWNGSQGTFYAGFRHNVQIQGVWGHGPDPYQNPFNDSGVSLNTGGITAVATTITLATGLVVNFSTGMTLRLETEQMYVLGVSTDTLSVLRGTMGTTAAAHLAGVEIYIAQYLQAVERACLLMAKELYNARMIVGGAPTGNDVAGTSNNNAGDKSEAAKLLRPFKRERFVSFVGD